jgi:nicotinate-nucleotide pyrophosphorylase (carboxylating)
MHTIPLMGDLPLTEKQIVDFIQEEGGVDNTTSSIPILADKPCSFHFISKESQNFILCGVKALEMVLNVVGSKDFKINYLKQDKDTVKPLEVILEGKGNAKDFLLAERVSLNLMQQLSSVSTNTFKMVEALSSSKIQILDTRKTIPGLRMLQKYAVLCGGGANHRFGLADMIMIKDNHIKASGGVSNAIQYVIQCNVDGLKIEVECETLKEVEEAIKYNIDVIMLDNMSINHIREASSLIRTTNIKIEVSGGVNLHNIKEYRELDVDFISSGSITHSIKSIDISAKITL